MNEIRNQGLRADAAGTMQALIGLWQIFVRQGSIPRERRTRLWRDPEAVRQIRKDREVFDAGRGGVRICCRRPSPAGVAAGPDDGPAGRRGPEEASDTHQQMVEDMIRVFEAQRLVSLDTLFDLADNLDSVARGRS